ncbi:MAG TPA: putative zinc-binding metallopeptidase [Gammaproteobacteria bacterium]|nr:putative zinc-binding metallopeptidase [Gammaproteobacteria bacterium]
MKTFSCICGSTLFFENSQCLSCGQEVGWCPVCRSLIALRHESDGVYRCGNTDCAARLAKCHNYAVENVCNRCVPLNDFPPDPAVLCDCCVYNDTIPDLTVEGNRVKWARLESAKRRLFYTLDLLGLPHGTAASGFDPPLAFDFKADSIPSNEFWRAMGKEERVYTGHADGKITINIREADPAERESIRVELDEAHRTLIGHFRHEIGHYYWDLLVKGKREADSVRAFGDHRNPAYADALDRHYREGAPVGWQQNFISAYATMHPWEDFAETFAAYLEMADVLDTASNLGFGPVPNVRTAGLDEMVDMKRRISVAMNEMNRTMGLLDFYPKILVPPVVEKMRIVHELVRGNSVVSGQVA